MDKTLNKKLISIIVTVFIVAIVCAIVVIAIVTRKTASVEFLVTPLKAKIEINGQVYSPNEKEMFGPGEYTATISLDGFKSKTVSFTLKDGDKYKIEEYLVGDRDGFSHYEEDYNDLYYLREYYSTHEDDKELGEFITKYDYAKTIRQILPLGDLDNKTGDSYYLSYKEDLKGCTRIYCLSLGASSNDYAALAIERIKANGYNPDDYMIIIDLE